MTRLISLRGNRYSAEVYLSVFASVLEKENIEHLVLRSPLDPRRTDGIYFPATGILFGKESLLLPDVKGRGLHLSTYEKETLDRRLSNRMAKEEDRLIEEAKGALAEVKEKHFCLEQVFSSAMNFEKMKKRSEDWEERVLKTLDLY